jgi:hypothetical protein
MVSLQEDYLIIIARQGKLRLGLNLPITFISRTARKYANSLMVL